MKKINPTLACLPQTLQRAVIHVFATIAVLVVPASVAVPIILHLSKKLPLSPVKKAWLLPAAQRLGWIIHFAVCAVWISPPPHTPLNASLLLQHIIFADHKNHPQRFPGRT